ncbi:putative conjugal transfer protein TraF [Shewanella sairae]|uniref:Signal peptidase I n=2 Tax=Shewanella sairae TaxID=190310 RepID=A0ABQ4PQB7_9GAMM|nr:conjugative transfer signal peptidase TraF [Shewanella sairae]GIU51310.1 putative conjugal transfer protein TraF [Shewanella sairae]
MITLFSLSFTAYAYGYRLNTSSSFPPGVYVIDSIKAEYQTNDLVLLCPPDNHSVRIALVRGYIGSGQCKSQTTPMIKRIAATYGDNVVLDSTITVNGHELPYTTIQSHDSRQRPLTPFALNGNRQFRIPYQHVFVYSDYAPSNSFDSRYFGFVPVENIQGTVKPALLFADIQAFIEVVNLGLDS